MRFWDSSAIVPLLVRELDSANRAKTLQKDPVMAVWWGTAVECESALERRRREGRLDSAGARQARDNLTALVENWHEVPPNDMVRRLAVRLLRTHALRAGDALQLAAALSLAESAMSSLPFLTADTRLGEAAEIEGLSVLA